jgi:two-component system LytT family response regulator
VKRPPASQTDHPRIAPRAARIRALIADDESLARQGIRMLLEQDADIALIEDAGTGKQAAEMLGRGRFDLVFLDVQMPQLDGFEALRAAGAPLPPAIIFVTAYDHYAVEAFEVNAVDYLLKPFTPRRFREALERAKERILSGSGIDARVLAALERISSQPVYLDRIAVRSVAATRFVEATDIDWLQAAENYVELHTGPNCHLVEVTMAEIARRLDPARFVRIHRSVIVNSKRIQTVQPASHSEYLVTLHNGVQFRSGRTYKDTMQKLISNPF